jgi:hypothetical protein
MADDVDATTAEPAVVAAVVDLAATSPSPPLTVAMATPLGPSTSTPGLAPFRCGPVLGGGVDVQQPLPSTMLASALTYGLPPQQGSPTFVPPLAHLPLMAWPPWMTPGALPYGLPLQ